GVAPPVPEVWPELAGGLLKHAWPGNVRELGNACAFAVGVAGARTRVGPEHWPDAPFAEAVAEGAGLHAETRALEERPLKEALKRTHGNQTQAGRALGLSRHGPRQKRRRSGIGVPEALDDVPCAD